MIWGVEKIEEKYNIVGPSQGKRIIEGVLREKKSCRKFPLPPSSLMVKSSMTLFLVMRGLDWFVLNAGGK